MVFLLLELKFCLAYKISKGIFPKVPTRLLFLYNQWAQNPTRTCPLCPWSVGLECIFWALLWISFSCWVSNLRKCGCLGICSRQIPLSLHHQGGCALGGHLFPSEHYTKLGSAEQAEAPRVGRWDGPCQRFVFNTSPAPTKRVLLGLPSPAVFAAGRADEVRKRGAGWGGEAEASQFSLAPKFGDIPGHWVRPQKWTWWWWE